MAWVVKSRPNRRQGGAFFNNIVVDDMVMPGTRPSTATTRTTRTPAFWGYPPDDAWLPTLLSHIESQVKRRQSQSYKFKEFAKISFFFKFWNKLYTGHVFWSCLIRCANMKWIRQLLLKIHCVHDSVHRRTDGQGETSIPPFRLRWSEGLIITFFAWNNPEPRIIRFNKENIHI